jgi:hypothetical protein
VSAEASKEEEVEVKTKVKAEGEQSRTRKEKGLESTWNGLHSTCEISDVCAAKRVCGGCKAFAVV